jgi:hypothetical protein
MKLVLRGLLVSFFILAGGLLLTKAIAGSTKVSKAITINSNWSRADAQKEFYQYEFPQMYNAAIRDIDTLYTKAGTSTGDSLYKTVLSSRRAWVDTVKTAAVYIPGRIAVDTNNVAQFTVTGIIDVDTMKSGTTFLSAVDINGRIRATSTQFFYFGDSATEGSWRIGRDVDSLVFQRIESGTWTKKHVVTP